MKLDHDLCLRESVHGSSKFMVKLFTRVSKKLANICFQRSSPSMLSLQYNFLTEF